MEDIKAIMKYNGPRKQRQKEVRNGLIPNHDFKRNLWLCFLQFYMDETLKRFKKIATLLPNNWLAETPQPLAVRRLGRQSAERERISEINWIFFSQKKTAGKLAFFFELICSLGFRVNSEPVSRYFQ
ncbi:hypothetical protein [Peribacillus frigoritolerans]|uniref:hypothetical protein n=1 Tax=Peribacillus frigoritolerans TaxID=450367 RepID=UPI003D2CE864